MLLREQNKGSGQDRSHSGQLLVLGLKIKVWGTSKAAQYMIHVKQGIYGLWYLNPMLMIDMILNTRMDKLSKMLDTQISLVSLPSWSTSILLHNSAPCEACFPILGCTARLHGHGESWLGVQVEKISDSIEPVHCLDWNMLWIEMFMKCKLDMPNVSCMYDMICCMYHFNRGNWEHWHRRNNMKWSHGHCDQHKFCIWNLALKTQFSTIVRSLSHPTFYHAWTPFPPPESRLSIFWFKILSSSRISSFRANMTRLHLTKHTWTGKTRSTIHHLQNPSNCSQMCFQSCQSAGQIINIPPQ